MHINLKKEKQRKAKKKEKGEEKRVRMFILISDHDVTTWNTQKLKAK